jgi:hypothetical protein
MIRESAMQWRAGFKMLCGGEVPPELDWGILGEWNPVIDYQWIARGIYNKQVIRFPIQSVTVFKGNEQIARWTHYDDAKSRLPTEVAKKAA